MRLQFPVQWCDRSRSVLCAAVRAMCARPSRLPLCGPPRFHSRDSVSTGVSGRASRPAYGDRVTRLGPASRRGTLSLVRQSSSDSWYSCCYPCITNRKTEVQREKKFAQIPTPRQNQERNEGPLPPLDFFSCIPYGPLQKGQGKGSHQLQGQVRIGDGQN